MSVAKVVVGVDGTPSARDAVTLGCALAAPAGADVLLLGAYPDALLSFPPVLRRDARLGEEAERLLLALRGELAPHARTRTLADVSPGRALCHAVEQERPDVLVLGSSHRAEAGRARAGRCGRQVIHGASCAVAVAASGLQAAPFALRHVVVGVDRSPEAGAALELARTLARAATARLTAVAVVDDRLPATIGPAGMAVELTQWDELVAANREHCEALVAELTAADPELAGETRVGDPAVELATAAEHADLLVIGSRRWGQLARLVVGSTGEELLHESPCSLLLVPRPATEPPRDA